MELLVIILIVGIVASVGLLNFGPTKEKALDKEAQISLKLIQEAEKIYRLETTTIGAGGYYVACADAPQINEEMKLSLPASSTNWGYKINITASDFVAKAQRNTGDPRTWCIRAADNDPFSNITDPTNCTW